MQNNNAYVDLIELEILINSIDLITFDAERQSTPIFIQKIIAFNYTFN